MSGVQDAIAAAQAQAQQNQQQQQQPETQQVQQVQQQQQPSYQPAPVQSNLPAAAPLSVTDAVNGSMDVDLWLKVKTMGVEIDGKMYRKVKCVLKCADAHLGGSIQAFVGLNYGNNADAKYSKTFNRQVVEDGENLGMDWNSHVAQVQQLYPSAKPFNGYALIFEVAEDTKDIDGNNPIAKGTLLGYSTSKTSAKEVSKFVRKMVGSNFWGSPENARLVEVNGKGNEMMKDGQKISWDTLVLNDVGEWVDPDDID